jgi:hypothetical protein
MKFENAVKRERDNRVLPRFAALLLAGMTLTGGFVFAAQQHFAAIGLGYDSQRLIEEHARLVEEQKRLLLEREEASAPARLEGAARGLGLLPLQAKQVQARKIVARAEDGLQRYAAQPLGGAGRKK